MLPGKIHKSIKQGQQKQRQGAGFRLKSEKVTLKTIEQRWENRLWVKQKFTKGKLIIHEESCLFCAQ